MIMRKDLVQQIAEGTNDVRYRERVWMYQAGLVLYEFLEWAQQLKSGVPAFTTHSRALGTYLVHPQIEYRSSSAVRSDLISGPVSPPADFCFEATLNEN